MGYLRTVPIPELRPAPTYRPTNYIHPRERPSIQLDCSQGRRRGPAGSDAPGPSRFSGGVSGAGDPGPFAHHTPRPMGLPSEVPGSTSEIDHKPATTTEDGVEVTVQDTGEFLTANVAPENAHIVAAQLAERVSALSDCLRDVGKRLHNNHIRVGMAQPDTTWTDCTVIGCRKIQRALLNRG